MTGEELLTKIRQVLGKVAIRPMGEYSESTNYKKLDFVTYNGECYLSLKDTIGNVPSKTEFWQLILHKPIKGTDYFTEEEVAQIIAEITEKVNSVFNQNVDEKTTIFNENATNKTTDFNTNAANKTTSFDTHVAEQTTTFDNHVADKITDFDTNATNKTTTFNNNATQKTTDFNTNAENKTSDFDTNASNQTTSFNENADAKKEEYDTNADNRMNEYNFQANELLKYAENMDNIVDKAEVSGELVQVDDALDYKLFEIKATLTDVSRQKTTKGIQLFDKDNPNETIAFINTSGTTAGVSGSNYSIYINCLPNTTYTISSQVSRERFRACSVQNLITSTINLTNSVSKDNQTKMTLTTGENDSYLYVNLPNKDCIGDLLIKIGTEASEYEPFTGGQPSPNPSFPQEIETIKELTLKIQQGEKITSIPINLQENEIVKLSEEAVDELVIDKKGNISLVKNTIKLNLDENVSWLIDNNDLSKKSFYTIDFQKVIKSFSKCLCNYLIEGTADEIYFEEKSGIYASKAGAIRVKISEEIQTIEQLKLWVSEHKLLTYCQLITPEIIPLGNLSELIKTYKGYNNIWIESDLGTTISVKYAKDSKSILDKRITNNSNRIIKIQDNAFEEGRVEGTNIHIEDSIDGQFKELEVSLDEEQKTATGANKFDISNGNNVFTTNNVTFTTDDSSQTLSIDGTTNSNINKTLSVYTNPFNITAGTYHVIIKVASGSMSNQGGFIRKFTINAKKKSDGTVVTIFDIENIKTLSRGQELALTFTTDEELILVNTRIITYADENYGSLTFDNLILQFYLGINNEYEPYTEGKPSPSPEYPQVVPIKTGSFDFVSCGDDLMKTIQTFTVPKGEFVGKVDDANKDKFRISYNQKDVNYHLYLNKNVGEIILDGSEKWFQSGQTTSDILAVTLNIPSSWNVIKNDIPNFHSKSTHFTRSETVVANTFNIYNAGANIVLRFDISQFESIDAIKKWLSSNNVKIFYPLQTPYTLDLGVVDMPRTYNPITNVYTTSDLKMMINAKYYKDPKIEMNNIKSELNQIKELMSATKTSAALLDNLEKDLVKEV